ncbi:sensor histidine kinase [Paenibacillus chondroitinus]|uniref:histidine kinase n=1 Tax=Paenibacillus chondroitinus TaxID=59842 RepID=A0ABU6DKG7_9BACL|nr:MULTISPECIES: sensor histidine kinase [Paenibacillus]MCY9660691.1 sensor histidine kinase [Paenibacillus anseongense]MEB4798129.1 sensor histidine kinase [Paenibacillus chondroitinus]
MSRWLDVLKNMRFKQKLILSYLVVSLIPLALLGAYSYNQSKLLLQKQAIQGLQNTVGTLARGMNDKTEQVERTVDSVVMNTGLQRIFATNYASLTTLSEDLRNYVSPYFSMIKNLNTDILQLTVYTSGKMPEYGEFILSLDRIKEGSPWYKDIAEQKKTGWYLESSELVVFRPFPTILYNQMSGILYLKLNKDRFFDSLTTTTMTTAQSAHDGLFISDPNNHIVYSNNIEAAEIQRQMLQAPLKNKDMVEIDGLRYILIQEPLRQANWTLHYYIPEQDISMDATSIVKATIALILTCMVILVALISVFSHTMIKRIYHLNKWMKQVQFGNLQMDIRSDSRDEIGELTNRFGIMLRRINELVTEVYQNKLIQKEAEFKALQAQINPHFLYNTLSVINWKSLKIGATDISHVVTMLSRFYRTALNRGESMTSLKDELQNTQSFVEIQLVMHDYSFNVSYQIDDDVYQYDTVNLSIQPLVENAIVHGIDQKEEGGGKLTIKAIANQDTIDIHVTDNGPGIDKQRLGEILIKQSKGYGLKNVNERIKLVFGKEYGIEVISEIGQGTTMIMTIPKYRNTKSQ